MTVDCRCLLVIAWLMATVTSGGSTGVAAQEQSKVSGLATEAVEPWRDQAASPRLSSPREMLELFRIDESQIQQLRDGRGLVSDEEETVVRILYRMTDFGLDRIQAWCQAPASLDEIANAVAENRLEFFHIRGRVTGLEQRTIPDEAARRLAFDRYYVVSLTADGTSHPVRLITRHVPLAWLAAGTLDERAGCCGLLLKRGADEAGTAALFLAAERIAWYPDRPEAEAGVSSSQVLLGQLGMDIGLLDVIRRTNRSPLRPEDGEAFYQMLAAVSAANPRELDRASTGGFELKPMLDRPETQQGRLITVQGVARRVQKILVGDPALQQRFGLDHYYQVDLFVPLGEEEELRMRAGEGEDDIAIFNNSFPVNLCVPDLPAGLPVGENLSVEIRSTGFYFKLWAYRTEFISSLNPTRRQVGPLLVAAEPVVIPSREKPGAFWGLLGGLSFLTLLGGLGIWGWLYRRSDRRFDREVLRPRIQGSAKE